MNRRSQWGYLAAGLVAAGAIGYLVGAARAAGVPTGAPVLSYAGYLEQVAGGAATGQHSFVLKVWGSAGDGSTTETPLCQFVPAAKIDVFGGHFQIPITDATCVTAIHGNAETWIEVLVDGDSVGRTKIGAVPYALESDRATDVTGAIHPASVTSAGPLSVAGLATFNGGIDLSSRVRKTPASTGTAFVSNTIAGTNVCVAANIVGFHPCEAWEAMVIDTLSSTSPFDEQGWIVASFPNLDVHMRSLANGQDSTICPVGSHLTKFPSKFVNGAITTPGGLHCIADATSYPVWCCKDKS